MSAKKAGGTAGRKRAKDSAMAAQRTVSSAPLTAIPSPTRSALIPARTTVNSEEGFGPPFKCKDTTQLLLPMSYSGITGYHRNSKNLLITLSWISEMLLYNVMK